MASRQEEEPFKEDKLTIALLKSSKKLAEKYRFDLTSRRWEEPQQEQEG